MQLQIKFNNTSETIEVENPVTTLESNTCSEPVNSIAGALEEPLNSPSLKHFLDCAKNVLIIVNDATRPTPTAKVIDEIFEDLKPYNVTFIIAVGTHRELTDEEYAKIFGKYRSRLTIVLHDAKTSEMMYLGTTSRGTEVRINQLAGSADKIIVIGSAEPHYFAGYSGGRKAILPGIAAHETIRQNHKLALLPESKILTLKDNPVHEDMAEACKMVKTDIFSIQTVLDTNHNIYFASAGDVFASHEACCEKVDELFSAEITEKADIIISVVKSPLNLDLYQSHKAVENAKSALKKGGIFILISECSEGIGNDNFYKLLSSCTTAEQVQSKIAEGYKLGWHKAAKLAEFFVNAHLWAVTNMDSDVPEKIFIRPFENVKQAIEEAIEQKGQTAKMLFISDGANLVPRVTKI
jgi:lactate racemase